MNKYLAIAALAAVIAVSGAMGAQAQSGKVFGVADVAAPIAAPTRLDYLAAANVHDVGPAEGFYIDKREKLLMAVANLPRFDVSKLDARQLADFGFNDAKAANVYVSQNISRYKSDIAAAKREFANTPAADPAFAAMKKCPDGSIWGIHVIKSYDSNGNMTDKHTWIGCGALPASVSMSAM